MILDECQRLVQSLQTTSEKFHGPVDKDSAKSTRFPFILLLGNHSSGKSSFINYILQRKVQKEGILHTKITSISIYADFVVLFRSGPYRR